MLLTNYLMMSLKKDCIKYTEINERVQLQMELSIVLITLKLYTCLWLYIYFIFPNFTERRKE